MDISETQRQEMVARIERVRRAAIDEMVEAMYQDPYWELRYGEKGKKFSYLDAEESIKKLTYAISLNLPSLVTDYYHWLQGLLVHRGMCTRQIQESIDGLAEQFANLIPEDWSKIEPYWRAGEAGLVYDHPACKALAHAEAAIAEAAKERLTDTDDPAGFSPHNLRYTLSYLYDAVGAGIETGLEGYLKWVYQNDPKAGENPEKLLADTAILKEEIQKALPGAHAQPFVRLLERVVPVVGSRSQVNNR